MFNKILTSCSQPYIYRSLTPDVDIVNALLTNLIALFFNDQLPPLPHTCKDSCPLQITLCIVSSLNCLSFNFIS